MGIVQPVLEYQRMEIEEFRRILLSSAGLNRRKEEEGGRRSMMNRDQNDDTVEEKLISVTTGVSYLGLAITNKLLARGFSVRLIVDNQEDVEKLGMMELAGELGGRNSTVGAFMANLLDEEGLSEAFEGCCAVFHTAAFIDPAGLSGYSKHMAEIEVKVTENVMKSCARTPSIRHCVLTSSLLACIWRDCSIYEHSLIIDHDCWSDESLCKDKKLWYALGKLRSEKSAWRLAKEMGLKLATICPGLVVGPAFCHRNPTPTLAYLKRAQDMYTNGVLATVDVDRLAEAHVCILEAMNKTVASGRYICFDRVVDDEEKAEELAEVAGLETNLILRNECSSLSTRFKLSNTKLTRLMSRTMRCYTY